MPHLDLSNDLSMYYEMFTSRPDNPWILLIHPLLTEISVVRSFTEQSEIKENFNCILFELRLHGRTKSNVIATMDRFTLAADLAFAMQKLHLPPVHVISAQANVSEVALALAAIFPERVSSLFLCGLAPDVYPESTLSAFNDCFQCVANPTDPEHWEEGMLDLHFFCFHQDTNVSREDEIRVIDEWTSIVRKRYSPSKTGKFTSIAMLELGRQATPQSFRDCITQPVLVCHGAESPVFPLEAASDRFATYDKLDPRSRFEAIPGAPLTLFPLYTKFLAEKFTDWILPIIESTPKLNEKQEIIEIDYEKSLKRLYEICKDPTILKRDPTNSSSFYALDELSLTQRKMGLEHAFQVEKTSFCFMDENDPEWWSDETVKTQSTKIPWKFSTRFEHS
ncbi:uncharacterized protein MELLADRAFT_59552 [Melampsora larici-populina 98AG31]|uniref:AB hydrolase-1 domain-containing protein n=1 Tax=Melampsora larici-populina (strain 98AG31 / pathotype 3-4-7) TaxID=747676 RepID=F4R7X5_MELLP|nr:uncharacterized protein MELLADRAFT_59552 [Melampsora larici-populina 98AG31]EGG11396.1 hypothetical protein MELLADRAFT_59552 [Melampsora larici-populina 98AG31]